jgi:signal transduction histidine kinase
VKRIVLVALLLTAGVGGLCTAWYVSSQRALDAELRMLEQRAARESVERERAVAENLSRRMEELRRTESQRPYFHYQNLYHDPKGASEGLSVVPSPLATGPANPLVSAYFQIDSGGRVTLPTVNEELNELNAPNAGAQIAIRDALATAASAARAAAGAHITALEKEGAAETRIADLEARLAAREGRRRVPEAPRPVPEVPRIAEVPKANVQKKVAEESKLKTPEVQTQQVDYGAFAQNVNSNDVYRELKSRAGSVNANSGNANNVNATPPVTVPANAPPSETQRSAGAGENAATQIAVQQTVAPQITARPGAAPVTAAPQILLQPARPIEIRTTDLQWQTLPIEGKPRLVALRAVLTPAGTLVQGMLMPLMDGMTLDRAGTALEGTGWRLRLDPTQSVAPLRVQHARDRTRFQQTFVAVCALLLAVVMGVVWVLSRVEKLATDRARFAATAAHELRTPLASLRLYSDLIAEEEDPLSRERYAREIAGQTERLGRVVANVLEVTRFERGTFALKPRPGAIGALVEECVARLRPQMEAAQCRIDLAVAGDLPQISFDPDALHHVVDNLVDNAEKFSRETPDRSIDVAVAAEEGGVAITVSDRGPGVPEELLRDPRPYRRATSSSSPAGLGLGLFLVNRIVRGHGGALRSVPRPGGGASVQVFLPAFYKP